MTIEAKAVIWWDDLTKERQQELQDAYTQVVGELSSREIVQIYYIEVGGR